MPTFRFECERCGANFPRRVGPEVEETACPCGVSRARKVLPRTVGATSTGSSPNGLTPSPTGFSSLDYNFDRVVAADAAAKWTTIRKRVAAKLETIEREKVSGFDLRRTEDGEYRAMPPREREISERSRQFHFEALRRDPSKKPGSP